MTQAFSGEPLTRWTGERIMVLEEEFWYRDKNGRQWDAPKGSQINGATIPPMLWDTVGSPYVGCYRRASIVHDVAVGELNNPDATEAERKAADRMFYEACLFSGCRRSFALLLYVGVSLGTWSATVSFLGQPFDQTAAVADERASNTLSGTRSIEVDRDEQLLWDIMSEAAPMAESEDLDAIDSIIEKYCTDR